MEVCQLLASLGVPSLPSSIIGSQLGDYGGRVRELRANSVQIVLSEVALMQCCIMRLPELLNLNLQLLLPATMFRRLRRIEYQGGGGAL